MIAYLEKYGTTVDVPDDASQSEIKDINDNFPSYVNQSQSSSRQTTQPATPAQGNPDAAPVPAAQPQWQPNLYEGLIKPILTGNVAGAVISAAEQIPGAKALAGGTIEGLSFGAAKPLLAMDPSFAQEEKDYPVKAFAGEMLGGLGSLMIAGGAATALGAGTLGAKLGATAVEAGADAGPLIKGISAAGQRFIPKAIMGAATFGTQSFIKDTVKAFQDGNVNLEQLGKNVLTNTAFGGALGVVGGLNIAGSKVATGVASVSSAAGLGFISGKMAGGDNRESMLHAGMWGAFELVGQFGKSEALRMEALSNLKNSMSEYVRGRNPDLTPEQADQAVGAFLNNTITKAGYPDAESIAKSGPENLLEGIEKVNQVVRTAKVPMPPPGTGEPLQKLPAPVEPEAKPGEPNISRGTTQDAQQTPQTPLQKAIEAIKGFAGIKSEAEAEPKPLEVKGDTYEEKIQSLKDQGHDVSKMPESVFPEDMKDVYHHEQTRAQGAEMEKGLGEIAERFQVFGIKPNEGAAIFNAYGIDKKGSLGQPAPLTDLVNKPIEEQYQQAFQTLAVQRGLDPEKPNAQVMDHAEKAVDLINGYFSPKSQEVKAFVEQHPDASDHDIAQMAYNRDLLEAPNPDLLKAEVDKAKQEKIIFHGMVSSGSTMERPKAQPKAEPRSKPKPIEEVASHLQESKDEITNLIAPYKSAPLTVANLREKLGLQARVLDKAEFALEEARKMFSKWTPEQITEFYDRGEHGLDQGSPELNKIDAMLKKPLSDLADEVNKLTGKLEKRIPNYMARYWEQEEKAIPTAIKNASKRPWPGSKSFLKRRTIDTFKEGIQAGITPASWNPVELMLMKVEEISKFLVHRQTLPEEMKAGRMVYAPIGQDHPEGWEQVPDSDIYKSPMIPIKEAYDAKIMDALTGVAKSLGINLERNTHTPKDSRLKSGDLWGLSQSDALKAGSPGQIWTRFAGPESAMAHELGHQLDHIYSLQDKFLSDPKIDKELTELAKERIPEGEAGSKSFQKYIQTPPEKMAVMLESYIHAPDLLQEKAPETYKKLESFLNSDEKLKPLTQVEPSLVMAINKSEVYAGGSVIAGHYYAPPDSVRIFKNYLSPGLSGSKIFRALRFAGNTINQFQLGFSAFHANFTSMEAMTTQLQTALTGLMNGDIKEFAKHVGNIPFAPISTVIRGNELLKAWRGEGQSAIDEKLANLYAISGGRAHMSEWYHTRMLEQMQNNFKKGEHIQGILRAPLAAVDAASRPIMEHLVPLMKMGNFCEMMQMEIKNNPNMTHDEARRIGQKIVDTLDDRMGQIVYDNLFWDKTFKDTLMLTFRSVGWNHGLIRLVAGALGDLKAIGEDITSKDILKFSNSKDGKTYRRIKPEHTYKINYWISSAILLGTYNAIYQRFKTGKGPSEPLDYLFPKDGGVDEQGNPTRHIPFQNYYKDLYAMAKHPVKTFLDKLNPLPEMISEVLRNRDFSNTQIVDPNAKGVDGFIKQAEDEAKFIAGLAVTPFSVTGMIKNFQQGNHSLESVIGPWLGDIPASYSINQTKAEELAHDINAQKQSIGGRTEEQMERSKLIRDLAKQYRQDDPKAMENLYKAYETGMISRQQMKEVITNSRFTPLQRMVKAMSLDEAERVYDKSNTEEKAQLELMMEKKRINHEREYVTQ